MNESQFDERNRASLWKVRIAIALMIGITLVAQILLWVLHIRNNLSWSMYS